MIGMLSSINNSVKTAKDSQRLTSLLIQLEQVRDYLEKNQTCLPLSPSMEICGLGMIYNNANFRSVVDIFIFSFGRRQVMLVFHVQYVAVETCFQDASV